MTKKIDKTVIVTVKKESILESIIKDTFSFCVLGALFYFNYHYINGSYFVNFLIILMILLYLVNVSQSGRLRKFNKVSDKKIASVIRILERKEKND